MVIDSPRQQPLPSIKTLFGISQSDQLSSIATFPEHTQARLQPPQAALTHFSLSELHGSLPHTSTPPKHALPPHWANTPDGRAPKPQTPSSARTASTSSLRTPSSAASPSVPAHYARHADHARARSFSDGSEGYDHHTEPYTAPPAVHAVDLGRRHSTMAIGARTPPPPPTSELAAHHHQRRVSSGSSVSVRSRSRSPLAQLVHPSASSSKAPGEAGFGGEHVLMRVQNTAHGQGEGYEFTKEFLAAKYECQYCGKRFNRPSSLKVLSSIFSALS
ncbi:hypothetical protein FRC07_001562 [Ceratobasidium sp. 392]|nr:hypothetical protein FRC07_001562 [Ceratobasidium sp. 392]